MRFPRVPLAVLLSMSLALGLAACGDDDESAGGTESAAATTQAAAACSKDDLQTVASGKLTVGTDKPAFPPYFIDDDPANGKGFESAVAYAVAEQLGFAQADVDWTTVPFDASYRPGAKDFDFDINQISITPEREKAVDFSSPYYTAPQAVLALDGTAPANAKSLADLADVALGVQVGTTSLDAVKEVIKPEQQPQVFNTSNDVVSALKSKRIDAIVVDLPTAIYLRDAEVEGSTVVGQFEAPGGDEWGLLLEKDSALTDCVSQAVDALREDGTLQRLEDEWMKDYSKAPTLQ